MWRSALGIVLETLQCRRSSFQRGKLHSMNLVQDELEATQDETEDQKHTCILLKFGIGCLEQDLDAVKGRDNGFGLNTL